jgi:hypothetical protein
LNKLLKKGDNKICQDGVVVVASDDAEVEVLVADMVWAQLENVSVQIVAIMSLIKDAFHVIR